MCWFFMPYVIRPIAKYVFNEKIMKSSRIKDLEAAIRSNGRHDVPQEEQVPEVPEVEVITKSNELTETEKEEMEKFRKTSTYFLVAGHIFATIFLILVLCEWIDFSRFLPTKAEDLMDIQSRIGFVFRHSTPGAMWILRCLFAIILKRARSPAIDPLSENEHLVQNDKNNLNNSLEQFVLALVSQLILVQHLDGAHTLRYIPALVFLFMFGRFTFWLGYPKYRWFGFSLNIQAVSLTMGYNLYKSYEALFF